jgi:myo-inositol-1(or 4)-monophosphatase
MDFSEDMALAQKAVLAAGEIVMSYFNTDIKVIEKSPNNPVTEADFKADETLKSILLDKRPNYGWLSEETKDDGSRNKKDFVWIVDPIDGTRAFIKGLPHFSISVALIYKNKPVLGIIYNPATKENFYAILGKGAFKNGNPIEPTNNNKLEGAKILGDNGMFNSKLWPKKWPKMDIQQRNSIAYRIALVAAGEFDGAIATTPKNDWDIAAGMIIANEAGAIISDHKGNEYELNGALALQSSVVVSNKFIRAEILDRLSHIR